MSGGKPAPEDSVEAAFLWSCVVGLAALITTLVIGHELDRRAIRHIPAAGVGLLVGALCAGVASLNLIASRLDEQMMADERFSFDFFVIWLLPPIIFEAGFNMDVAAFGANIGPTIFLALLGTAISSAVVGALVWLAGQAGLCYPLGLLASFTFGSIISATDPVTVLAVFQQLGVDVDLFSIIFGESVLNDAVAIVLSRMLLGFNSPHASLDARSILGALLFFCVDFLGSMAIGGLYGVLCSLLTKALRLRAAPSDEAVHLSVALCGLLPWASYYTAEALGLSGIVTILFCGMLMSVYTRDNLSDEAARLASRAFKCVAIVAETFVFIYLGEALFSFPILHSTVWRLVGVALVACALGRSHVWAAAWLNNQPRNPCFPRTARPLSRGATLVLWWSGLRGGVAFALAAAGFARNDFAQHCGGLPRDGAHHRSAECVRYDGRGDTDMSDSLAILQTTLLVAAFSIFALGGSVSAVARRAGVVRPPAAPRATRGHAAMRRLEQWSRAHVRPWLTSGGGLQESREAGSDSSDESEGEEGGFSHAPPRPDGWCRSRASHLGGGAMAALLVLWLGVSSDLNSVCDDAVNHYRLVWAAAERSGEGPRAPRHAGARAEWSAAIFGEETREGAAEWCGELAQLLGVPRRRVRDCSRRAADGRGAGRWLRAQLARCAPLDNGTLVFIRLGADALSLGGEAADRNETLGRVAHSLLAKRRSRLVEAAFEQVVNFSLSLCAAPHGCPRAIILSPPRLSLAIPAIASAVLKPDPWLSRLAEAYACFAGAELAHLPLRLLARAVGKDAADAPIILFSEVSAAELARRLLEGDADTLRAADEGPSSALAQPGPTAVVHPWVGVPSSRESEERTSRGAPSLLAKAAAPAGLEHDNATAVMMACVMSTACSAHRPCAHLLPASLDAREVCDRRLRETIGFKVQLEALTHALGGLSGHDQGGIGLLEKRWLLSTLLRALSYLHSTTPIFGESLLSSAEGEDAEGID